MADIHRYRVHPLELAKERFAGVEDNTDHAVEVVVAEEHDKRISRMETDALNREERLRDVAEYADHAPKCIAMSWTDKDCRCGLLTALRRAGMVGDESNN